MGCFNVSCGITGISMYCDKAVLIPLAQMYETNLIGSNLISNEGINIFFSPFTLPLFGNLDSYGRLEDVIKDVNVECIEKFFSTKIEDFCERLTTFEGTTIDLCNLVGARKSPPSGMWVNYEIWKTMIKQCPDGFGKSMRHCIWTNGLITPYVLGLIGFIFKRDDQNRARYNKLYTNKNFPEVEIWSDGNWINLLINNKEEAVYELGKLVAIIELKTKRKFPERLVRKLMKTPVTSILYDQAVQKYNKDFELKRQLELVKTIDEKKQIEYEIEFNNLMDGYEIDNLFNLMDFCSYRGKAFFKSLYGERVVELKQAIVDFRTFERNMIASNRFYCPTTNHCQYGNHYGHLMIAEAAVKVLKRNIREREGGRKWLKTNSITK